MEGYCCRRELIEMSTIPDDLRQVIRELEKIQEVRERSLNDDPEYKKR